MAIQGMRTSAVALLALLPFFVLSAEAWWQHRFDHLNNAYTSAEKAAELGLHKPGAEYLHSSGCDFTFPAGRPGLDEAYGASTKAVRTIDASFSLRRHKPHSDALNGVARAIGGYFVPEGGNELDAMLHTLSPMWADPAKGAPVEDLEQFKQKVKSCYGQVRDRRQRLACLDKLEREIGTTGWGSSTHSLHVFPLAVTAAALYPVIASDYLTELDAQRNGIGYATEAARIRNKARAIIREVEAQAVDAAVRDLFPQPLINQYTELDWSTDVRGFGVEERRKCIKQDQPFLNLLSLLIVGKVPSPVKDHQEREVCVDARMELCKPATRSFDQTYQDARNDIAPTSCIGKLCAWLTGSSARRGKEVAIASYQLSPYNTCTVEGRHPDNAQDDDGWARTSRRALSNVGGLRVKLATFAVTQALVERYYDQGARWARENLFDVADSLKSTYNKFDHFLAAGSF